jgi:membrane protease subunit HflC
MNKATAVFGILMVLAILALPQFLFTVDQTESALVLELGKYKRTILEPGLKMKIPFMQQVTYYDNRVLEYDAAAKGIITKDKKNLVVDNYAKWRIKDPLTFYQTKRNEVGAQALLDDIIYSSLREELGKYTLSQMVSENRAHIMEDVTRDTNEKALSFGIEVVDVRIKRADLPPENEKHVFGRMQAERQQEAKKYRSEGEEVAIKIRAGADKERAIILAEARRTAEELKGEGDATATKIYAEAYQKDREFFEFIRSMDAYKLALGESTLLVISPESEFFRFLRKSR